MKNPLAPRVLSLPFAQAWLDFPITQEYCKETNDFGGRKLSANAGAGACLNSRLQRRTKLLKAGEEKQDIPRLNAVNVSDSLATPYHREGLYFSGSSKYRGLYSVKVL